MIESLFSGLTLADVHGDLYRNIVSLRVSEDLFDDLSTDAKDWESAIQLEIDCKPPLFSSHHPVISRPFEEADWNAAIEYPFRNWQKSRFSDGTYGVWYGGDSVQTTVFETVHHWVNGLLSDAGWLRSGVSIERKVYLVRCDAALIDFKARVKEFPQLVDKHDYSFTQQAGFRIHKEGHPGVVSSSARCDGDNYVIFNKLVLNEPRQNCLLTYTTTDDSVRVERTPGELYMSISDVE